MTVGEFKKKFSDGKYDDLEMTVQKSDKFQLSCHTTVPIESATLGFDWTYGQVVLEPKRELSTSKSSLDENMLKRTKELSTNMTRLYSILQSISDIVNDMDEEIDSSKNDLKSILEKV